MQEIFIISLKSKTGILCYTLIFRCVVCGKDNRISKFNVVPHSYRKFFPVDLKSHSSHDIVLLCTRCHRNADMVYVYLSLIVGEFKSKEKTMQNI